jgi:hypothetical protein
MVSLSMMVVMDVAGAYRHARTTENAVTILSIATEAPVTAVRLPRPAAVRVTATK